MSNVIIIVMKLQIELLHHWILVLTFVIWPDGDDDTVIHFLFFCNRLFRPVTTNCLQPFNITTVESQLSELQLSERVS